MKKIISFIFIVCLGMSVIACSEEKQSLSVLLPNGTPAIAQSNIELNQSDTYTIDRVDGPQALIAGFTSESHDIIIAPVNLGANLYQKDMNYQLAGVLTWSNLQIVSRQEIASLDDLVGKDIYGFGQGSTPQMIIDYTFSQAEIDGAIQINYESTSVQEALLSFMQNEDSVAILAQPITSKAKTMIDDIHVFDLNQLWSNQTDQSGFPQAGIFVHESLTENEVNQYLQDISDSVAYMYDHPLDTAMNCESLGYALEKDIIEEAIPQSGINYVSMEDANDDVLNFLNLILEYKPALIGGSLPDDDFYHIAS
jgi:NitT/TauT family transport system substrate-binding protein